MFTVEITANTGAEGNRTVETATYWVADMKAALTTARLLFDTVKQQHRDGADGFVITDRFTGAVLRFHDA